MLENSVIDREKIIILALLTGFIVLILEHPPEVLNSGSEEDYVPKGKVYAVNFEDGGPCTQFSESEEIPSEFEVINMTQPPEEMCRQMISLKDLENYFEKHLSNQTDYEEEILLEEGLRAVKDRNYQKADRIKQYHKKVFKHDDRIFYDLISIF